MSNFENSEANCNIRDKRILLFLLFLPCLLIRRVLDNDVWFLLNSGRYVMNYGIPHTEPFSIHKNMKFVMQQWLTDVTFWNIYDKFGENGLFILVMICYTIIIFLMYKLTMKVSGGNFFVSFSITMLASILIYTYMVTRPTIFTLVLVLIELNILESFSMSGEIKHLYILPLLSLLMINLHAALWPMLFIMMLPYIAESFKFKLLFIECEGHDKKYLLLTFVIMILIAFINPYGFESMIYLVKSSGNHNMVNILELQPPYISDVSGMIVYLYIFFIAFIYIFYKNGKSRLRYFLLTAGTIYMALLSLRNITYFALCSLFPLAYYLKDLKLVEKNSINKKNKYIRGILVFLISIFVIISFYKNSLENNTYKEYLDLNNTINYILGNEKSSNIILYTSFNDGALVQFRGLSSYIDPRAEVYFKKHNNKDDIFNEYINMRNGRLYYKKFLDKYHFTHLIVSKGDILDTYLSYDINYKIIYYNDKYLLFKKIY